MPTTSNESRAAASASASAGGRAADDAACSSSPPPLPLEQQQESLVVDDDDDDDLLGRPTVGNTGQRTTNQNLRRGTILSASINILSTMVGGGSLSLPLAFGQAGIGLVAPLTLIAVAMTSEFCMWCLVQGGNAVVAAQVADKHRRAAAAAAAPERRAPDRDADQRVRGSAASADHRRRQHQVSDHRQQHQADQHQVGEDQGEPKGTLSYELIASHAFGPRGHLAAMVLVSVVCYFATVGYAVLLRDLLEPFADYVEGRWLDGDGGGGNGTDGGGGGNNGTNGTAYLGRTGPYSTYGLSSSTDYTTSDASYVTTVDADPTSDGPTSGPTLARNIAMCTIVLLMTPFCLLTNLTALKNVGMASMAAVLILGVIIGYRSVQCNLGSAASGGDDGNDPLAAVVDEMMMNDMHMDTMDTDLQQLQDLEHEQHHRHDENWFDYLTYAPTTALQFITAFPIFVSCFICHYNVPPIHNELQNPTSERVNTWLKSTVWSSTTFYLVVGFAGSMYGNCTPSGTVQGNILLDFEEDDALLLIGRSCLALTISLAFPMLVIPPRDIVLRAMYGGGEGGGGTMADGSDTDDAAGRIRSSGVRRPPSRSFRLFPFGRTRNTYMEDISDSEDGDAFEPVDGDIPSPLTEPLLLDHDEGRFDPESPGAAAQGKEEEANESGGEEAFDGDRNANANDAAGTDGTACSRAVAAIVIFWSGAAVACSVRSIDIVWDLLGSSLSICLGFLIPCASYLALCPMEEEAGVGGAAGDDEGLGGLVESFNHSIKRKCSRIAAWSILIVMIPMMIVCTANAAYNTFFRA